MITLEELADWLYEKRYTVDGHETSLGEIIENNPPEDIVGIEDLSVGEEAYFGIVLVKRFIYKRKQ